MIRTRTQAACLKSAEKDLLDSIASSDWVLFERSRAYGLLEGRVRIALIQLKLGNAMEAQATLARALGETA